jgi:outer membrane protein assembly factor BamC
MHVQVRLIGLPVKRHLPALSVCLTTLTLALAMGGCSSLDSFFGGSGSDYKAKAAKVPSLEVPPDLTQLARDGRYQVQGGVVSASGTGAAPPANASPAVAPTQVGTLKIEREGNTRWLVSSLPPEVLWPKVRAFWQEGGFTLTTDNPQIGVMETNWAENRSKIPTDVIRNTIGRLFDALYSSGERDRFRTRVERSANGTEIYISHRGMEEVYQGAQKDATTWQARSGDAQLEAEMLGRLMVKIGAPEGVAKAAVAGAAASPERARLIAGQPAATMQVDDSFDRSWRRLGIALDRSGFTVEDRERGAGLYYVRYVDPKEAAKEDPNFFAKLFSSEAPRNAPVKYRLQVKAQGNQTLVTVLNGQGIADNGTNAQRIVSVLLAEMK